MTESEQKFFDVASGDRVMVFDPRLYVNDIKTPLSYTVRPATVTRRWHRFARDLATPRWEEFVDVCFDHRPDHVSRSHFLFAIQRRIENDSE